MSSVEQQVKAIVAEQLGVKAEQVTNDASFVDDLGADSLDTVELVMALEEEFEIEIPDEDAEKITTVQQAIDYITRSPPRPDRPAADPRRRVAAHRRCLPDSLPAREATREQAPSRRHWPGHRLARWAARSIAPGPRSCAARAASRRSRASTSPTFPLRFGGAVRGFDVGALHPAEGSAAHGRVHALRHRRRHAGRRRLPASTSPSSTCERCGVITGAGIGGLATIEAEHNAYLAANNPRKISPFFVPSSIINMISGHLSIRYGLRGPNLGVVTACTTSTHAIGLGMRTHPVRRCRPRDRRRRRDGHHADAASAASARPRRCRTRNDAPHDGQPALGQGSRRLRASATAAARWCSRNSSTPRRRGARIYAELVGFGMSGDAHHITAPPEDGEGARLAMRNALRDAGDERRRRCSTSTRTPLPRRWATRPRPSRSSARSATTRSKLAVSSTKSMTGHLLGAAGVVEAMFSVLAIRDQVAPPTINLAEPGSGLRPRLRAQHRAPDARSTSRCRIPSASAAPTARWSSAASPADAPWARVRAPPDPRAAVPAARRPAARWLRAGRATIPCCSTAPPSGPLARYSVLVAAARRRPVARSRGPAAPARRAAMQLAGRRLPRRARALVARAGAAAAARATAPATALVRRLGVYLGYELAGRGRADAAPAAGRPAVPRLCAARSTARWRSITCRDCLSRSRSRGRGAARLAEARSTTPRRRPVAGDLAATRPLAEPRQARRRQPSAGCTRTIRRAFLAAHRARAGATSAPATSTRPTCRAAGAPGCAARRHRPRDLSAAARGQSRRRSRSGRSGAAWTS